MMSSRPFDVRAVSWPGVRRYDGFVAVLGFESRSRHIAGLVGESADQRLATAFPDRHELAYSRNARWFATNGWDARVESDAELRHRLARALPRGLDRPRRLGIDISCLSRARLA